MTGKPALSPSEVNRALSGAGFRPTMKLANCHYLWSFALQGLTPAGRAHTGGLKTAKSDNQHFQKGALSLMLRKRNSKVSGEEAQCQFHISIIPVAKTPAVSRPRSEDRMCPRKNPLKPRSEGEHCLSQCIISKKRSQLDNKPVKHARKGIVQVGWKGLHRRPGDVNPRFWKHDELD